jgi:serine phosphatase RsbU (regulator of sigma subunit)
MEALSEHELKVILDSVDAAITVRDTQGRMVYANQAAADLLRLADVRAVEASPPGELMSRFDVYSEAGDPINLADLPGTRLLAGSPSSPPIIVRNVIKATGEERWLLNKVRPVSDGDGNVVMAVNLIEDITETKRNEIAQRLLASTARRLTPDGDVADACQAIADAAVPGLADWAGVDIIDPRGDIATVAVAHRDPEKVRLGWRLRAEWPMDRDEPGGLAEVMRTGEPQLITEISDEMLQLAAHDPNHLAVLRAVGLNSTMITPIAAGERVLGALSFVSSTSRRFDRRDLELASDLGRQVGAMILNAQLNAEQARIARTLQAGLVPQALPELRGWQLSSAYRAAGAVNEVGGDFYDVVRFTGGWAAIIGDVLGKGAEAAAVTALARHTLAAIIESTGDVAYALSVLNRRLLERDADFRSMCTLAVTELRDDGAAVIYSAGHPPPLLVSEGAVVPVGVPSPMLGFLDEVQITPTPVQIGAGEQVVMYTDGVLDAVGPLGRLEEDGLTAAVLAAAAGGAESLPAAIMTAIDQFVSGEQTDDIALLGLRRLPVAVTSG